MARKVSQEVKRRYEKKAYQYIRVALDKKLVARFKKKCDRKNVSYNSVLVSGIKEFMYANGYAEEKGAR